MSPREALTLEIPDGRAPAGGDPGRGAALYVTNCANCHGPDGRGAELGPCLVEKPVLWRGEFVEVVRKGLRRMPGFTAALKPEQELDILAWLRTRRVELPNP
jgi:mono/diheme cytochrome c family protein